MDTNENHRKRIRLCNRIREEEEYLEMYEKLIDDLSGTDKAEIRITTTVGGQQATVKMGAETGKDFLTYMWEISFARLDELKNRLAEI